ncbi:hypothetical protein LV779_00760 [Streptomyces thinghirensis]|nr:hypothetical protein [Streptomyces thinghirensis]
MTDQQVRIVSLGDIAPNRRRGGRPPRPSHAHHHRVDQWLPGRGHRASPETASPSTTTRTRRSSCTSPRAA